MFLQDFSTLLEYLTTTTGYLIFIGDFNFHVDDLCNSDAARFVSGPTHKKGHTLDLIIHREEDTAFCGEIDLVSGMPSDHSAVVCSLDMKKPRPSKVTMCRRNVRRLDFQHFRTDILDSELHCNVQVSDVDALTEKYNEVMRTLIDNHAPERTFTVTLRPHAPWYTDELRLLKRQKRRAERKFLSTRLEVYWQAYRAKCTEYTNALDTAKSRYYREEISTADQNQLFHMISVFSSSVLCVPCRHIPPSPV